MKGPLSSKVQYSKWNFTTIVGGSKFQVMVISIIGLVRKITVYSLLYCLTVPFELAEQGYPIFLNKISN